MDAHSAEKPETLSRLAGLVKEFSGGDASGLNLQAVVFAESFLRALPESIPIPEFAVEPGGDISLDWIASRDRVFSLSVGPTNRLAFAWLDGTNKGHGVESLDGGQIPKRIIEGISAIVGDRNAAFGIPVS